MSPAWETFLYNSLILQKLAHPIHPSNLVVVSVQIYYLVTDTFFTPFRAPCFSISPCFHRGPIKQEDSICHGWLRKINHGAVNNWKTCVSSIGIMWLPGCDPTGTRTKGSHSYSRMLRPSGPSHVPCVL